MPFPRNEEKQTFIRLRLEREPHPGGRSIEKAKKYYGGVYHRLAPDVRRREVDEYERQQQEGEDGEESDEGSDAIEENETAKDDGADGTQEEEVTKPGKATAVNPQEDGPTEDNELEQRDDGSIPAQDSSSVKETTPKKPRTASLESDVSTAAGNVLLEQVKATESNTQDASAAEVPASEDDSQFEDPGAEKTSEETTANPQREDHVSGTAGSGGKDAPSTPDAPGAEADDHNVDTTLKAKPRHASVVSVGDEESEAAWGLETSARTNVELQNEEEDDGPPDDDRVTGRGGEEDGPLPSSPTAESTDDVVVKSPDYGPDHESDRPDANELFGPSPVSESQTDDSVLAGRKRSREDEHGDDENSERAKVPRIEEKEKREEAVELDEIQDADEEDASMVDSNNDENGTPSDDEPVSDEDIDPPASTSAVEKKDKDQLFPYLLNFEAIHHREDGDVSDDHEDDDDSLDLETQIAAAIDGTSDDALELRDHIADTATLPGGRGEDDFYYPDAPPAAPVAQMAGTPQRNPEAEKDEKARVDELMSFLVVPEGSQSKREESAPPAVEQRPQKRPHLRKPGQEVERNTSVADGQPGERRESVNSSDGRTDQRANGTRTGGAPSLLSYLLDELPSKGGG